MSAVAVEKEKPKVDAAIKAFEKAYGEALESARVSQAHTDTEGWQELYTRHRKNVVERRKGIGERLRAIATDIERGTFSEDTAKAISDCKKGYDALCGIVEVFESRTVEPVIEPVHRCKEVKEKFRMQSREEEGRSPLTARGVAEAMEKAIKAQPDADFDEETGRVAID